MPETEIIYTPLRVPVGPPREYAPAGTTPMDELRSRSNRKYLPRYERNKQDSPIIAEATEQFNIGTPRSRSPRKQRFKIAHDVDSEVEQAHQMMIDDEEMLAARDDELRDKFVEMSTLMLQEVQNKLLDEITRGKHDKRREENANPNPAQPKAKTTTGWTPAGHGRYTPNESIPKSPPPNPRGRPPNQPEAEPKPKPEPKPRGRPPNQPEAEHDPRPKSTPASSSTDTPYAKAKAKAEAKARAGPTPEETQSKPIPVKKNSKKKPAHDTDLVVLENFNEWKARGGKGFLVDQIHKRPGIKFSKTDAKKKSIAEMIQILLKFDGKI
jgi:hypothetical protein